MTLFTRSTRAKVLLAATAVAAALGLGCKADTSGLQTLAVEEVVQRLADAEERPLLCDANNDETRARFGSIAGALLLSSYRDYDLSELSTDKSRPIVFFCHSEMCGAAAEAARRAIAGGYEQVSVMPAGIVGWAEAGHAVSSVEAS